MNGILVDLEFSMSIRQGYLYWRNQDTVFTALTALMLLKHPTIRHNTGLTFASLEPNLQIGSQVFEKEEEFLQAFGKEVTLLLSQNVR